MLRFIVRLRGLKTLSALPARRAKLSAGYSNGALPECPVIFFTACSSCGSPFPGR